jgi:hypothetical protein
MDIEIMAFLNCTNLTNATLPNQLDSIGDYAFCFCSKLPSIAFPNTLRSIGSYAFRSCTSLVNVTFPDSLTTLGDQAFVFCNRLETVTLPRALISIGISPFEACSSLSAITVSSFNTAYTSLDGVLFDTGQRTLIQYPAGKAGSYALPATVTSVGPAAFMSCSGLTGLTLSTNLSSIGDQAFMSCAGLTSVTIPKLVTSIGIQAFAECTSLLSIAVDPLNPAYSSMSGVLFDKNQVTLIQCPAGKTGSYTPPGSITSIGDYAFDLCSNLTAIAIPASVTNIGNSSFYFCTSLTNLVVPNSVQSIGPAAFSHCLNLANITLPESLTSLKTATFMFCPSLSGLSIPATVTNIGSAVFSGCTSLSAINVNPSNQYYSSDSGVLLNKAQDTVLTCPAAKSGVYAIPTTVTNIGLNAFAVCWRLTRVTIPSGVTTIANSAFAMSTNITGIYFEGNAPTLGSSAFLFDTTTTVYILPGTSGWGATFGGLPVSPWKPEVLNDAAFGVKANQFGFDIFWARGGSIVVESRRNFSSSSWTTLQTSTLTNGSLYFSDPNWINFPASFYRIRSP